MLASSPSAQSDLYRSAQEEACALGKCRWTSRSVKGSNPVASKDLLSSLSLVYRTSRLTLKLIGEINPESYILATLQLVSVSVCPSLRAKVNNAFIQHIIVQIEPIDHKCANCDPSPQLA